MAPTAAIERISRKDRVTGPHVAGGDWNTLIHLGVGVRTEPNPGLRPRPLRQARAVNTLGPLAPHTYAQPRLLTAAATAAPPGPPGTASARGSTRAASTVCGAARCGRAGTADHPHRIPGARRRLSKANAAKRHYAGTTGSPGGVGHRPQQRGHLRVARPYRPPRPSVGGRPAPQRGEQRLLSSGAAGERRQSGRVGGGTVDHPAGCCTTRAVGAGGIAPAR